MRWLSTAIAFAAAVPGVVQALAINDQDPGSIKAAARTVADNLMSFYSPSKPDGGLGQPYWWWEAGGMLGSMLEYFHYTGDATYNDEVAQAIAAQAGPGNDFMQPQAEGNDDQGWWAITAMTAAEYGIPSPPGAAPWVEMAKNVFNQFEARYDMTRCNGGMKWKILPNADGWHYKSTISNGLAFQLAARLARFTKEGRYLDWATNSFAWTQGVGLISNDFMVFDGTDDAKGTGCIDVNHDQWTYNAGVFLYGAAVMQSHTQDQKWVDRTNGLLGAAAKQFFIGNVMVESQCEKDGTCNVDQRSFKAYLARWLASTASLIPATQSTIAPLISASANAAAVSCSSGAAQMCGPRWYMGNIGGQIGSGVGEQMSAMEIFNALLVPGMNDSIVRPKKYLARRFVA